MAGQFSGDVTVLPIGWTDTVHSTGDLPSEVSGSWSITLSPDGRHAAYVSDRGGVPQVWVQPVGSALKFLVDTGVHPVVAVSWSTGGGWLACQIAPGGGPRHELWLVRPDGSALHQVAGFGTDTAANVRWLPGRPLLVVTENLTAGYVVDVESGSRDIVASAAVDGDLIALLDVSPDRRRALLRHGPRGSRYLTVRDLATGADEYLTSGEQAVFAPDGRTVYARSEAGEYPVLLAVAPSPPAAPAPAAPPLADLGVMALHKSRIPVGIGHHESKIGARDSGGGGGGSSAVLAGSDDAEVEAFEATPDGRRIAVLWNVRGGLSELTILSEGGGEGGGHEQDGGGEARAVPLPGLVVSGLAWSADGSTLAFTAEGPGQPHGVWTYDDAGTHPVSAEPAAPDAIRPVLERFPAHDGLELTGWLYRPRTPGPHPAVLWFHGGPEAQERPGHGPLFQSLADRGIAVLAPNVRGSSGFGRSFVNADNGPQRYAAIADVASCVRHLVDTGIVRPDRVGVMGRSYGGYLTLAALVTYPELFAVGIDVCGMSNFATFYEHTEPWIAAAAVSKYGDPLTDADLLRDLSPIARIDRLRAPLMLVHGENDTNVPVIEAHQVAEALSERGVEHRFLLFEGEGHELLHRSSRAEYLRATVDWLSTHLLR